VVDKFDNQPEQPDRLEEEKAATKLSNDAWDSDVRSFGDGMLEAFRIVSDSVWNHQVKPKVAELFSQVESRIAARRASQDVFTRLSQEDKAMEDAYAHLV